MLAQSVIIYALASTFNGFIIRGIAKFTSYVFYHMMILTSIPSNDLGIVFYDRIYHCLFNMMHLRSYYSRYMKIRIYLCLGCIVLGYLYSMVYYSTFFIFQVMTSSQSYIRDQHLFLYFYYVNLLEVMSFMFVRTRSSIKYLPKLITISNLIWLMYISHNDLPHFRLSLGALIGISGYIYLYFIIKYEY